MSKNKPVISRKEFLKKSSAAVLGIGLAGQNTITAADKKNAVTARPLGRTGIRITPIGFGAPRTMEAPLVRAAADAGINFFDTGRSYFNGMNEGMVGEALAGQRKNVIIQSKLEFTVRRGQFTAAEVKRVIGDMTRSLEESLKALRTDYIDIMLIHNATDPELSHHEAVREFFTSVKKSGKIRTHGFSSHTNHIEMLRAAIKEKFYDVVMIPYNHKGAYVHSNSGRTGEWKQSELDIELKKARELGMGLIAMKTCSGGPCPPKDGGKPDFPSALRWIFDRNQVDSMAVAIANFQQLEENMLSLG